MSHQNTLDWMNDIWSEFKRSGPPWNSEGVVDLMDEEIEKNPLLASWVIDEFVREENSFLKELLASLIVIHTPYTPAIEWLRDNSDWTKEDFAEFGINIDDY